MAQFPQKGAFFAFHLIQFFFLSFKSNDYVIERFRRGFLLPGKFSLEAKKCKLLNYVKI